MRPEPAKSQNIPKEWQPNSAKIHVSMTSQPQFQNNFKVLPDIMSK